MSGARIAQGGGAINVATGVPVLDHLLTELARAGGFELTLEIEPDDPEAEVDAAGTALGRAVGPLLSEGALGEATAPADEALAMVVVERSDRPLRGPTGPGEEITPDDASGDESTRDEVPSDDPPEG